EGPGTHGKARFYWNAVQYAHGNILGLPPYEAKRRGWRSVPPNGCPYRGSRLPSLDAPERLQKTNSWHIPASGAEDCLYNNCALLYAEENPHAQTGISVRACACRDKPIIGSRQNHRAPWTGRGQRTGAKQPWPERLDCVL